MNNLLNTHCISGSIFFDRLTAEDFDGVGERPPVLETPDLRVVSVQRMCPSTHPI